MSGRIAWSALLAAAFLVHAAPAGAGQPASTPPRKLVVGTKESPPFSIKADDGTWTGLSVELWRQIAARLELSYEIKEYDLEALLAAVGQGQVDVAVGAITINAARERLMDFSHPIYSTGLSIAVLRHGGGGIAASARGLLSWNLAGWLGALLLLLAAVGALMWLSERRQNSAQFARPPARGIAAGFWWSAVTMTTVGYGDKAPVTVVGRILALFWMFAAIILFSFFTASITSSLTLQRLESTIKGPGDLADARVTTIPGSTSASYLEARSISYRDAPTVLDGLRAVVHGDADAMVYDAPILQYSAKRSLGDAVMVLPEVFHRQDYGFAVPEASSLRESINRALLAEIMRDRWQALLQHYVED
jgi:ABC-type amino acid transport substrate-binding protein